MGVSFFGGPDGTGARVWSTTGTVSDQQDPESFRARIRELEALCTSVLVAGVDIGLPQRLLNQLWGAVGHGDLPQGFHVDLPPAPRQSAPSTGDSSSGTADSPGHAERAASALTVVPSRGGGRRNQLS